MDKEQELLDAIDTALRAAYARGYAWHAENPNSDEYLPKAARDYADKITSDLQGPLMSSARRSSDEQAEVVEFHVTDEKNGIDYTAHARSPSPAVAAGGVTEALRQAQGYACRMREYIQNADGHMTERERWEGLHGQAMNMLAWEVRTRPLTAALAVGDEGIREGWLPIVRAVWDLLGGEDATRVDGQNLVARVREVVAERDEARDALKLMQPLGAVPLPQAGKPSVRLRDIFPADFAAVDAVLASQALKDTP